MIQEPVDEDIILKRCMRTVDHFDYMNTHAVFVDFGYMALFNKLLRSHSNKT
jgi:hypothetical protein